MWKLLHLQKETTLRIKRDDFTCVTCIKGNYFTYATRIKENSLTQVGERHDAGMSSLGPHPDNKGDCCTCTVKLAYVYTCKNCYTYKRKLLHVSCVSLVRSCCSVIILVHPRSDAHYPAPAGGREARRGDVIAGAPPRAGQAAAPEEQGAQAANKETTTRVL